MVNQFRSNISIYLTPTDTTFLRACVSSFTEMSYRARVANGIICGCGCVRTTSTYVPSVTIRCQTWKICTKSNFILLIQVDRIDWHIFHTAILNKELKKWLSQISGSIIFFVAYDQFETLNFISNPICQITRVFEIKAKHWVWSFFLPARDRTNDAKLLHVCWSNIIL